MAGQSGMVLPAVLATMAVGTLLVTPFLSQASASLISTNEYGQSLHQLHAAEAGVEHAIWDISYDDLATQLSSPGDSITYQLGESINTLAPSISVTLTGSVTYSITSVANGRTIEADVDIQDQNVTVLSWRVK